MADNPPAAPPPPSTAADASERDPDDLPKLGGYTRFEVECEFVQSLSNPRYLNFLASQKYLEKPEFINYLQYLLYWKQPTYAKYLTYPGPTIKALDLLQKEDFRAAILSPMLAEELSRQWSEAAMKASIEAADPTGSGEGSGSDKAESGEGKMMVVTDRTAQQHAEDVKG